MATDTHERFFRAACILVIDDDDGVRTALSRLLETSGYRALAAASGAEGVALLESHPGEVALCICDFKMPGLDGIETLTRVHAVDKAVIRVLLTGYATLDAAIEATNRGLDAFVTKPYQSRELRTKLQTLLAEKAQQVAHEQLAGVPLFRGLPDAALALILPALISERVPRGQVVQEIGVASERLSIVREGELHLQSKMSDGRLRSIAYLGPGEHFGDGSLALGEVSPLRAVASVDTELLVLKREELERLKAAHPQIAEAVAFAVTRQLHKVIDGANQQSLIIASIGCQAIPRSSLRSFARALVSQGADVGLLLLEERSSATEPGPHPMLRAENDNGLRIYRPAADARDLASEFPRIASSLRALHKLAVIDVPQDAALKAIVLGQAHRTVEFQEISEARVNATITSLEPGNEAKPHLLRIGRSPAALTAIDLRRVARRILGTTLGVTLGAGGARGLAHIGLLQAFASAGLEIDAFSGASIGAAAAGCLASGLTLDETEAAIRLCFDHVMAGSRAFGVPVWERVWRTVHEVSRGATFEEAMIPFICSGTELVTGEEYVFTSGLMAPAVCASMATPGIFPAYHYDGRVFSDAALVNGLPTDALISRGYDLVAAVDIYFNSRKWRAAPRPTGGWRRAVTATMPTISHKLGSLAVVIRALTLAARYLVLARADGCDLTIRPDMAGSMSRFDKADFGPFLEAGRAAGEPAAKELLSRRAALMSRWRKS